MAKTLEQIAAEKKAVAFLKAENDKYKGLTGLILEACKAFGVALEFLFASRVDGDEAVIITNGGKRVRYKKGDKVEPLDYIAVTGINPAAKKRKVIAGKKKKD